MHFSVILKIYGAALGVAMLASPIAGTAAPLYHIEALAKEHRLQPSLANAINRHGVVTGGGWMSSRDSASAFVLRNGHLRPLDGPDASYAAGNAINAGGAVVGVITGLAWMWGTDGSPTDLDALVPCERGGVRDSSGRGLNDAGDGVLLANCVSGGKNTYFSYLYSGGALLDLGHLGGGYNGAQGINNLGQVVGASSLRPGGDGKSHVRAYIWEGGLMHELGTLGGPSSFGRAINDLGHVVGKSTDASEVAHGFIYDGSTMTALPTCDNKATLPEPMAINKHDEVVGTYFSRHEFQGFLVHHRRCYPLLAILDASGAGWGKLSPTGINDDGTIVGWGLLDNKPRAFVATPVQP